MFGSSFIIYVLQHLVINSLSKIQERSNAVAIEEIKQSYAETLKTIELKHQKEIENHKTQLSNYMRYSDEQFKLYNEFWSSIYDLKIKADDLWEIADNENLFSFAEQLKDTSIKVEKARLFIEEDHYQSLKRILRIFSEYSVGKTKLIHLKQNRNIEPRVIDELIRSNGSVKIRYDNLTENIFISIKKQIYFPAPTIKTD